MSELPVTSGGKVDRAALTTPSDAGAAYLPEVAAVLSDVLGEDVPESHYPTDIVELDGTSLQIALVVGRLVRELSVSLPAEAWLYKPTVAGFAELIHVYRARGPEAVTALHARPDLGADLDDEIFDALDHREEDHHVAV
jgi:acyl carrier protein